MKGARTMKTISVVVPCLNEQEAIPLFYSAFLKETAGMDVAFEFWFVDDGSTDGTLEALKRLREPLPDDPCGSCRSSIHSFQWLDPKDGYLVTKEDQIVLLKFFAGIDSF